jgi:hypothetical protein
MATYRLELNQTVLETTVLYVQAHSQEQAELIAEYIAKNGKDPLDRKFVDVTWDTEEINTSPHVYDCEEDNGHAPCNTMPEHTEGLFKQESKDE